MPSYARSVGSYGIADAFRTTSNNAKKTRLVHHLSFNHLSVLHLVMQLRGCNSRSSPRCYSSIRCSSRRHRSPRAHLWRVLRLHLCRGGIHNISVHLRLHLGRGCNSLMQVQMSHNCTCFVNLQAVLFDSNLLKTMKRRKRHMSPYTTLIPGWSSANPAHLKECIAHPAIAVSAPRIITSTVKVPTCRLGCVKLLQVVSVKTDIS